MKFQSLICKIDGCTNRAYGHGWCKKHYQRWYVHGHPETLIKAPAGSGWLSMEGYKIRGSKKEHRLIAEKALGKPLPKGSVVHHVNGIKTDNRPENLVVCPNQSYHILIERRTRLYNAGKLK